MVGLFCGSNQCVKGVGCLRGEAPLLIFDRILNATLSEGKVSAAGVTQRSPELPLPPNSFYSRQTQSNKMTF